MVDLRGLPLRPGRHLAHWRVQLLPARAREHAGRPIRSLASRSCSKALGQSIIHLFNEYVFNDDRGHIHSQSRVDGNLCRRNSDEGYAERTHQFTEKIYPPHPGVHFWGPCQ